MINPHAMYIFENTKMDAAVHTYHILVLLQKLKIAIANVEARQDWVEDTTLFVEYTPRVADLP